MAQQSQPQGGGQQQQQPQVDVSGPQSDTAPVIVRKKNPNDEAPKPEPKPEKPKKIEGLSEPTFTSNSALVNVDVSVIAQKNGQFIPGLHQENFEVLEDGVPQRVVSFAQTQKPITAVLLVEFANMPYPFLMDMLNGAYTFTQSLKKDDYIAVTAFDMKPRIIVDFTQDKNAIQGALNQLRIPGFSETNVFDALYDTVDRLEGVEGHKYIILLTRGIDTFSKLNLDKTLKKLQGSKDITIYAVSTGQAFRLWLESHGAFSGAWGGAREMDYLQADNQLKTFAKMTGGKAYFPRFDGEFPEIFGDIASTVRNQYSLAYHPTNSKLDGTYRKLAIKLVAPDGEPLKIVDQKGKEVKITVIARDGYRAAHTVE
ncbi:MAG: VWA domain-containing protein [Acidobacteriales bacterium]|nr:VWA domain-containing protein [Terriglobales bacterium]